MSNEFKEHDSIKEFNNLTECLSFPLEIPFRKIAIYLVYQYVDIIQMEPLQVWFKSVPHRAFNNYYSQRDLKIIFDFFDGAEIEEDPAKALWKYLRKFSLHSFLECLASDVISNAEYVCSLLEMYYDNDFAAVFHLYFLLSNHNYYAYKEQCNNIWYRLNKCSNKNDKCLDYIGEPLSEDAYIKLCNAINNSVDITCDVETKGDAVELYNIIKDVTVHKPKQLKVYNQYQTLSEKPTNTEKYVSLARNVSPSDFILAQESIREAELECNVIFGKIFNRQSKKVLIVNPSIALIRLLDIKIKEVNDYRNKYEDKSKILPFEFHVIVDSEDKATMLRKDFKNIFFFSYKKFYGCRNADYFYFCGTDEKSFKLLGSVINILNGQGNENTDCCLLIADKHKKDLLELAEKFNFSINRIDSFPKEISHTPPKKKSLVSFSLNENQVNNVVIRKYGATESHLIYQEKEVTISKEDLYSDASISDLMAARVSKSIYNKALEVAFSRELSIFYKYYPGKDIGSYRVIAYLRENIKDKSKAEIGKKIKESEKEKIIRCDPLCVIYEIEKWLLKEYILFPKISEIAVKLIKNKIPPKSLFSLRSFWLINKHKLSSSDEEIQNVLKELAFDDDIGNLIVGEASSSDYQNALEKFPSKKYKDICLEALEELLEFSLKDKLYNSNPISSIFYMRRKEKADYDSVRSALTKKTFSEDEEAILVKRLLKTAKTNPYDLAVLIELFTGLSVNEIAALKKENFLKQQNLDIYYLSIHNVLKKENGEAKLVIHSKREKHRKIPVVPLVSKFLMNLNNPNSEYLLSHPDTNQPLRPWKISENFRKLLKQELSIEEDSIYLPGKDGDGKETDLNNYFGNFLRADFRYRLRNTCKMELMECDYLLGNKRNNAYGNSYCDFSNDFMQIRLYKKLCRWEAMYLERKMSTKGMIRGNRKISITGSGGRISVIAHIVLNDTTKVSISSKNGTHINIFVLNQGGNDA